MKGYFKTALFGGYDKESVLYHIDELNRTVISLNEQLDCIKAENTELRKQISALKGEEICDNAEEKRLREALGLQMTFDMIDGSHAKEVF